jgi:hypothetical protein
MNDDDARWVEHTKNKRDMERQQIFKKLTETFEAGVRFRVIIDVADPEPYISFGKDAPPYEFTVPAGPPKINHIVPTP